MGNLIFKFFCCLFGGKKILSKPKLHLNIAGLVWYQVHGRWLVALGLGAGINYVLSHLSCFLGSKSEPFVWVLCLDSLRTYINRHALL